MSLWETVVCPVDFSDVSLHALRYAADLCRDCGARLVLLHVVEPIVAPSDFSFGPVTLTEVEDGLLNRAKASLEDSAAGLGLAAGRTEVAVARGRASDEIVRTASEKKADLVVMGTHGYAGFSHALLGSTAERVVRKARCPVLTVKPSLQKGTA
jgi:nucleotide-binding universal stress UspA family protein